MYMYVFGLKPVLSNASNYITIYITWPLEIVTSESIHYQQYNAKSGLKFMRFAKFRVNLASITKPLKYRFL